MRPSHTSAASTQPNVLQENCPFTHSTLGKPSSKGVDVSGKKEKKSLKSIYFCISPAPDLSNTETCTCPVRVGCGQNMNARFSRRTDTRWRCCDAGGRSHSWAAILWTLGVKSWRSRCVVIVTGTSCWSRVVL